MFSKADILFGVKRRKEEMIMKTSKKLLTGIILVLTLMLCLAFAASADEEGYYTYTVKNGEATITYVDKSISGDVVVPSTLGGYTVTGIGSGAFANCTNMKSLVLTDSIVSIEDPKPNYIGPFEDCINLEIVIFGKNLTRIPRSAFRGCTGLKNINIPDNITSIGESAFCNCDSLESIIIPGSIKEIPAGCFYSCESLNSITLEEGVISIIPYDSMDGWVSGNGYRETIGSFAFCKNLSTVSLPSTLTKIGYDIFWQSEKITDVYYNGTKEQWDLINIGSSGNESLKNASIHFKHSHSFNIVSTSATCTANGHAVYTCICGYTYTEILPSTGHSYTSVTTPATCTANGQTVYTCSCNDTYTEIIPTTGHDYDNAVCTKCGVSKADDCSHLCHKSGFMGFIWKIVQFFWKLFKMNPVCECGMAHY